MKIKFLIILSVMTCAIIFWYFSKEIIDQEKLYKSYKLYLVLENKEAEKKYGNLIKGKEVKLQKFSIISCEKNKENICHIKIKIENFRGLKEENIVIKFIDNNNEYKIINILTEVKE